MKKIILTFSLLAIVMLAYSQSSKLSWAKKMGGKSSDAGSSIVVDKLGNVYTTGWFSDTADFDPDPSLTYNLVARGNPNFFISKLDAFGNFVWAKNIECNEWNSISVVTLDISGNIYIAGSFKDTVDFDLGLGTYNLISEGDHDIFILKLNTSGDFVWVKNVGGDSSSAFCDAIKIDELGNVYTLGDMYGTIDFNPDKFKKFKLTSNGESDIFILKLDPLGNFVWAKSFGGKNHDVGTSICLDESGNLYSTGYFELTVDFDPGPGIFNLTTKWSTIFILKLNANGDFVWVKSMGNGDSGTGIGRSILTDASYNVYITGNFNGTIDFDPDPAKINNLIAKDSGDIFILKLDKFGKFLWAKKLGNNSSDAGFEIKIDKSNNIYIGGAFGGTVDFDPDPSLNFYLTSSGSNDGFFGGDMFILKLDDNGNFIWAKKFGGSSPDFLHSITIDDADNLYITGGFLGFVDFESGNKADKLTSEGDYDIFVCKIQQDSCSKMVLIVESIRNNSCIDSIGYISIHILNGVKPYSYFWDTKISSQDSFCSFSKGGLYPLTVTDSKSCIRKTSILIDGPSSYSGFDLKTNLTADIFRPGRQSLLNTMGFTERCSPVSGNFSIVLDKRVSYNGASPSPDKISGDTLIWNFSNLTYDSKPIKPSINVITQTKATRGDTVCFDVLITPINGDANPTNNKKRYCYPIVNSYDPNIKSVYPPGTCQQGYVLKNKPLTYTVQFQNTGNAEAIDIYILDPLDAHLDIKSLRVIGQSHNPPITEILPGRVLKFRFDNINLPDSFSDEKGSHGYVVYEIMPDSTVANGSQVLGKAGIYFDFNPPVFTNEVKNTLTNSIPSCNVGIHNPKILKPVNIYPNPNTGNFTIKIENPGKDISIEVFDMMGKLINTVETIPNQAIYSVDLNSPKGIYLVKVKNGGIVYNQKVVLGN